MIIDCYNFTTFEIKTVYAFSLSMYTRNVHNHVDQVDCYQCDANDDRPVYQIFMAHISDIHHTGSNEIWHKNTRVRIKRVSIVCNVTHINTYLYCLSGRRRLPGAWRPKRRATPWKMRTSLYTCSILLYCDPQCIIYVTLCFTSSIHAIKQYGMMCIIIISRFGWPRWSCHVKFLQKYCLLFCCRVDHVKFNVRYHVIVRCWKINGPISRCQSSIDQNKIYIFFYV